MKISHYIPTNVRAPLAKVFQFGVRTVMSKNWIKPQPISNIQKGSFLVSGFINEIIGIGQACRMTIDAMRIAGIEIIEHDLRATISTYPNYGRQINATDGGVWLIHANAPECEIAFCVHRSQDWGHRYRIGYWAWETTLAPHSWVRTADWLHEIWTPSQFSADGISNCFLAAGRPDLIAKLLVMPPPCPTLPFCPDRQKFGIKEGVFAALTTADSRSSLMRKNPIGAIEAWILAFPEEKIDAVLIVKTIETNNDKLWTEKLRLLIGNRSDIRIIQNNLSYKDMASLISSIDLYISLHRSEGFGLPLAEAMSLGRAVMATNYSASTEFINGENGYPISATIIPVYDPSGTYSTGFWGEPCVQHASNTIRWIYNHPDDRIRKGKMAKKSIKKLNEKWNKSIIAKLLWHSIVNYN